MVNHTTCDFECNKACKIDKYSNFNSYPSKKHVIGKLLLEFEDEILNTSESCSDDQK